MTSKDEILIALWVAAAGAAFVVSPFVAAAFPGAFEIMEAVGRSVYVVGLAACIVVRALRFSRSLAAGGRGTGARP